MRLPWPLLLLAVGCNNQLAGSSWSADGSRNLINEPRHPVTQPMWLDSKAVKGKPAPAFALENARGGNVSLAGLCKSGPVVLIFTKDNCPCSIEAQPFFNALANGYKGRVTFVGVIEGPAHVATKYADDFRVPYDMLLSGDGSVFAAYRSTQSAYSTLVNNDGLVVRQWPGYSRSMLAELDKELAKLVGIKPVHIDTAMAPVTMNSGCAFEVIPATSGQRR